MGTLRSEDSDDGENVASKMKLVFFQSISCLFFTMSNLGKFCWSLILKHVAEQGGQ